jgi:alpha-tubulin suppressor-like RCC1 family protein
MFCSQNLTSMYTGSADDGSDPCILHPIAEGVEAAAGGFDHCLIVRQGSAAVFGPQYRPSNGSSLLMPIALPLPVSAVAAGEHHSLLLTTAGDLYAFGSNRDGQLGSLAAGPEATSPILILGPSHTDPALATPITNIAAGARHNAVINASGQCLTWGCSLHGQCGTGVVAPSINSPTVITSLGPLQSVGVAAGMRHTVCCTDEGDVYAWGSNSDGELGTGEGQSSLLPQLVEDGALEGQHVVEVATGGRHTIALCRNGLAFAWGYGAFGQLGNGSSTFSRTPTEVVVPEGTKVSSIQAGWWHTVMVVS